MEHQAIPVTILTGFLGAGKTTLLNKIIKEKSDENIILIINEFGETGIDHELVLLNDNEKIYQMNNGCICCILREDLADMFYTIIQARDRGDFKADRIVIETSGLAEPSPIAQTIVRTPMFAENLIVDSILTLVDADHGLHQLSHYEESVEQVAFADLVYLTKVNDSNKHQLDELKSAIKAINPYVDIKVLDLEQTHFKDIIGLDLFDRSATSVDHVEADVEGMLEREHEHHHDHDHDHEHHHHHHSAIDAFSVVIDEALDEEKLDDYLESLIINYGANLLRYKGILNIKGQDKQIVLQGINMAFRSDEGKDWKDKRQTKVVFIGKDLSEDEIRQGLMGTISQ